MVKTFFQGSPSLLMATLLESSTTNLSEEELSRLEELLLRAKEEKK
jgi:hypothetical protein